MDRARKKMRHSYTSFAIKVEDKRLRRTSRHKWEDSLKINLNEGVGRI